MHQIFEDFRIEIIIFSFGWQEFYVYKMHKTNNTSEIYDNLYNVIYF